MLLIATLFSAAATPAQVQDKPHVVSLTDLNNDSARTAQTRKANEEAVRTLLSSEPGQKAIKSAHLNYRKVDEAVGQLSDEDLAKLAERSRQVQVDFAAGRISNTQIALIIVIAFAIIVVAVILPYELNHS